MDFDPQLLTEISKLVVVKLSSVVRDNHPQDPKSTDDVLPDEVLYFDFCDYCQWFCFHPLRKIINSNNQKFDLFFTWW